MPIYKKEHEQALKIYAAERADQYADLLSALGKFLESSVLPLSTKFDSKEQKITAPRKELLAKGICRIAYPERYGGLGLPSMVYIMAMELAGTADAGMAMSIGIHNTAADGISSFGNEEQKKSFLAPLISGEKLGAFALTEPTSGSDARAIHTTARKTGGRYVLNGTKMFITNAGEADVYFVFATTDSGPSSFLVEKDTSGLMIGEDLPKLGMRGSRTAEVRLVDCEIPAENLVGQEGKGFDYATSMLNGSRIVMGSLCVGVAQLAFEKATAYSKQRKAFGKEISDFQLIREKIADMKTGITAGRLLCLYASRLRDMGADYASEAAQAKVFATEMSQRVCDEAIQILGGYGYTNEDVHRHWRDARLLTIGEGTSEVLRLIIASRELAKSV
ncbi:MAG TPA: acyl-CoA dehydrogenase family protein [Nitrososphaerales archaeon]|nr:acyl-CoA dehydrogenase family protein [Nitrososphaerales archaeon]